MKIFIYKCCECGIENEVTQNITDETIVMCPKCQNKMYRTIGISHFIHGY